MDIDPRLQENRHPSVVVGSRSKSRSEYPDLITSTSSTTISYPPAPATVTPYDNSVRHLRDTLPPIIASPYYPQRQAEHSQNQSPRQVNGSHNDSTTGSEQSRLQAAARLESLKRPRSCEACRALKVKCERNTSNTGACKRCTKARRECIFTEPSHKRRKKADSKVAELEKKIDALTASLKAVKEKDGGEYTDSEGSDVDNNGETSGRRDSSENRPTKRRKIEYLGLSLPDLHPQYEGERRAFPSPSLPKLRQDGALQNHEYADVIDRGVLDPATASEIFQYYKDKMMEHMPAVRLAPGTTSGEIRRTKPTLFLAILSVASTHKYPELQRMLNREAMETYANKVIVKGEKSLELVQALQISAIWHAPESQDDTRPYQLVHMSATMAMAMRLGQISRMDNSRHAAGQVPPCVSPEADSLDAKRAWISAFVLCGNAAQGLKQQNVIHWSHFLDDCLQALESTDDNPQLDKILCCWAKLFQWIFKATELVYGNQPAPEARASLDSLAQNVKDLRKEAVAFNSKSLDLSLLATTVLFHLMSMRVSYSWDNAVFDPMLGMAAKSLTPGHIKAIKSCIAPMHEFLEKFLSLSQCDLDAIPSMHFVRVTYCMIALLYIHITASAPDSDLGKVIDPRELRVGEYIGRLLDMVPPHTSTISMRGAQKFQMVIKMFRAWFERQKERGSHSSKPQARSKPDQRPLEAQPPIGDERDTPRLGYRKLSVQADGLQPAEPHSSRASEMRSPISQKSGRTSSLNHRHSSVGTPLDNTALDLLSQVATSANHDLPSTSTPDSNANGTWYNLNSAFQPPPVTQHSLYSFPNQTGYSDPNFPSHLNGQFPNMPIDPALEQAMGNAFGSEGSLATSFISDIFGTMPVNSAANGMVYGGWNDQVDT